jgi:CheY-like chemotaxis protein
MKRILIIEDDPITARVYSGLLTRNGYQVDVAVNIRGGLERLADFHPDGVLLDLMLPDSNGLDFLKTLRGIDRCKALPVIVYTNLFVPGMTEKAIAAGATKIFDKATLTPTSLVDTFNGYLNPPEAAAA